MTPSDTDFARAHGAGRRFNMRIEYALAKRAEGFPWTHVANMAGCSRDDLTGLDAFVPRAKPVAPPKTAQAAPEPKTRKTDRREPGGLMRAVLLLVGDGYPTSLQIARVLDISIDNANGALKRLDDARLVDRKGHDIPVRWIITDLGAQTLRDDMQWMGGE